MKALLLTVVFLLTAISLAQPVPTYAWRRVTANPDYDFQAGVTTDVNGNGVYAYTEDLNPDFRWHLVRISPANNIIFDHWLAPGGSATLDYLTLSPLVSGGIGSPTQYAWLVGQYFNQTTSIFQPYFACYSFAHPTNPVITGVIDSPYGSTSVVGIHADANGNLMVAMRQTYNKAGATELEMLTINRAGTVLSDQANTNIKPYNALWSNTLNEWIVDGNDNLDAHPQWSGRWGAYDPATGNESFGETVPSYYNGTETVVGRYVINMLPGDNFGVIRNYTEERPPNPNVYYFFSEIFYANGTKWNEYPFATQGGGWYGGGEQTSALSANGPFYVTAYDSSRGNYVWKFDFTTAYYPVWEHDHQPVTTIYPTPEGYFGWEMYTPSQAIFLEHYIEATNTYDWGRSYTGTAGGLPYPGNLAFFQNYFYVLNAVKNTNTGYDLIMERFVTGICLHDISCATSVKQGNQLTVLINLNGTVAGSPVTVALNSSSPKLLLPNGTQGQNFSIPVGQNSLVVNLNAQAVTSNTSLLLTAIQNGVRRTAPTTVTP